MLNKERDLEFEKATEQPEEEAGVPEAEAGFDAEPTPPPSS